jgi:hypothetical protein
LSFSFIIHQCGTLLSVLYPLARIRLVVYAGGAAPYYLSFIH